MLLLHNKIKYMRARMNHTYKIIENIIKGRSIITILLIKFQFLSNATTMTWNISNEDVESDRRRKKKKKERIRKESYRYIGYEKSKNRSDAMIAKQRIFFFFFFPLFSKKLLLLRHRVERNPLVIRGFIARSSCVSDCTAKRV